MDTAVLVRLLALTSIGVRAAGWEDTVTEVKARDETCGLLRALGLEPGDLAEAVAAELFERHGKARPAN